LKPNQRQRTLSRLTDPQIDELLHDWRFLARPEQLEPEGDWLVWLFLAGRGAGKTRSGAEWVRHLVKTGYRHIGLIAPTAADARDIMVEGPGGIMPHAWAGDIDQDGKPVGIPTYEPSKRRLTWANGAQATMFSAEEPDRLRGPQHSAIWADELIAWKNPQETWDMAMFGLRMGIKPRAMITTTGRPIPLLREIMRDPKTAITRATTHANRRNLAPSFLHTVVSKYAGTRLGRQELGGEILDETEGALWRREHIEKARLVGKPPEFRRVAIGVDPAVTKKADSNLTGIVAAALGVDGRAYVLADASGRYSPHGWAEKAVGLYKSLGASVIVAEGNQGGDMVRATIQQVMPNAPVRIVHASRGKYARAEPIALLYDQDKVRHVGAFAELEDQMATWEPLGDSPSPDRLDAYVWVMTELMLNKPVQAAFGVYGQV